MPRQIHEIKDFLLTARRKDAECESSWAILMGKLPSYCRDFKELFNVEIEVHVIKSNCSAFVFFLMYITMTTINPD